ncbi:MAG: hypothetical protein C4530_06190 [Desulfobacteraceae bacterium]|nr:MAG: hypothetical protein C4530_06190 [Desulfobacteraceae bacterium]
MKNLPDIAGQIGPEGDGLNAGHIPGSLSHHADIPGGCIGRIRIENQITFIDVQEKFVDLVPAKKSSYRIGRRRIYIDRA